MQLLGLLPAIVKYCVDGSLTWYYASAKGQRIAATYAWLTSGMVAKFPIEGLVIDLGLCEETSGHLGRR